MSATERLRAALVRLRRRALLDNGVRWGLRAALAIALWATVVAAGARWWSTPSWWITGGGGAVIAGAAVGRWWMTRPQLLTVARCVDARLQLRERLATALTL